MMKHVWPEVALLFLSIRSCFQIQLCNLSSPDLDMHQHTSSFMQSLSRQASKRQHASLKRSDVIKFIGNFLFDIIIAAPKRTVTLAPAPPLSFPSPSPDAVIKGNYLHRHSTEQSKQGVAPNRRSRLDVSLQFSLPHSINLYLSIYLSIYLYLFTQIVCSQPLCVVC